MRIRFIAIACFAVVLYLLANLMGSTVWAKAPQSGASTVAPLVVVSGEVKPALQLNQAQFDQLPHRQVTTRNRDGVTVTYSGVPLLEILHQANVPLGNDQLKGKNLALYVLAEGADNFRVVFSLAELDSSFTDRTVLLANQMNGQPLPATEGPLRLIVPTEKRFSRWVKQVTQFKILRAGNS